MTQEILDTLRDVLSDLELLHKQINEQCDNLQSKDTDLAVDLTNDVVEPLSLTVDNLTSILDQLDRFDNIQYYNDPYDDELN